MPLSLKKIVLAADHAGFVLKEEIKKYLQEKGINVTDVSEKYRDGDDYPPVIRKGCAVVLEDGILGIIFGGSGNGEAIAANKVRGIRAAVGYSEETARLARAHNNANVLSIGARFIAPDLARNMVDVFLVTPFEGGRHRKRVENLEEKP